MCSMILLATAERCPGTLFVSPPTASLQEHDLEGGRWSSSKTSPSPVCWRDFLQLPILLTMTVPKLSADPAIMVTPEKMVAPVNAPFSFEMMTPQIWGPAKRGRAAHVHSMPTRMPNSRTGEIWAQHAVARDMTEPVFFTHGIHQCPVQCFGNHS